jgi:hypothetical protein
MSNQIRIEQESSTPKDTSAYQAPNVQNTLARASQATSKVFVAHGSAAQYFDLQGKTVGYARKKLREVMNIPGDAQALIGGKSVDDDFVLESTHALEFVKEAGVKG